MRPTFWLPEPWQAEFLDRQSPGSASCRAARTGLLVPAPGGERRLVACFQGVFHADHLGVEIATSAHRPLLPADPCFSSTGCCSKALSSEPVICFRTAGSSRVWLSMIFISEH